MPRGPKIEFCKIDLQIHLQGLTRASRCAILPSSCWCSLSNPLRFADSRMRSAFATDGPGPQSDASNNKFRSMRIARSAVTSRADVNQSPSSLSDARPEGPASVDGRVEWLATHGPSHPNASSGTKTFAENVAHTARGTAPHGSCRYHARIRAFESSAVGPGRRARSAQLPTTTSRPRTLRARAEGL